MRPRIPARLPACCRVTCRRPQQADAHALCRHTLPRSDDGRQALAFPDLVPYLLANFGTVQEAVNFLDPTKVQVGGVAKRGAAAEQARSTHVPRVGQGSCRRMPAPGVRRRMHAWLPAHVTAPHAALMRLCSLLLLLPARSPPTLEMRTAMRCLLRWGWSLARCVRLPAASATSAAACTVRQLGSTAARPGPQGNVFGLTACCVQVPQHISLMDATGNAALIEFSADPERVRGAHEGLPLKPAAAAAGICAYVRQAAGCPAPLLTSPLRSACCCSPGQSNGTPQL